MENTNLVKRASQQMSSAGQFNVVIVSPPNYQFSETFREIGETVLYGLRGLGHAATICVNDYDPRGTNIILGGSLLDEGRAREVPPQTIIYNFEQVHGSSPWIKPVYVDLIRRFRTWDYSERNVRMWRRYCPFANVLHVPLGYVPEISRISPKHPQDIDVLFYGVINQRRATIIDELKKAGLNVVAVFGKFGAERDALIARSKVVLNVHSYEAKIFELSRVSYLLANRKAVVSEIDDDTDVEPDICSAVAGVTYSGLVDKCVELVFDDVARARLADAGYRIFSQRSEQQFLAAALRAPDPANTTVELPKRINVGSGKAWDLESLNLDSDPLWMPDLLADLNRALPSPDPVDLGRFGRQVVPEAYFDEIRAIHVLEHVSDLVTVMESFLRLLRVGGILSIEVPYELSYGAWQDPTHVRAMNERSWLYYTDWFWYLGWREHRFTLVELQYVLSEYGDELTASGTKPEQLNRIPRAIDVMRVKLQKITLSHEEKVRAMQRWTNPRLQ